MIQLFYWHMLVLLIVSFFSCGSSEKAFERARPQMPFDAVVVPGVPFDTTWSDVMRARVLWSYHLYKNGLTKNVIYTGSAVYTPFIEARIMALYAIELGIPAEHVFTEEKAEHSTENIFYSYYLAKDLGFERIALTTDPFQNAMLKSFVKEKELDVSHVPANFDTVKTLYSHLQPRIDPTWAKVTDFTALPDRKSFWKRLQGTMGKNLKYAPAQITNSSMRYEAPPVKMGI